MVMRRPASGPEPLCWKTLFFGAFCMLKVYSVDYFGRVHGPSRGLLGQLVTNGCRIRAERGFSIRDIDPYGNGALLL